MAKKLYTALTAITHDGERYETGETIELDDRKDAPQLVLVGAIELAQKVRTATKTTDTAGE